MAANAAVVDDTFSHLQRLFGKLRGLDNNERLAVCCFMSELVNGAPITALIDQVARAHATCPRCASNKFCRHGFANGLQRYRCHACGKTFNGLTGTPLARLRLKQKWLAYCDCLRDPACTVKRAAAQVAVHANTSFRWRHRFLHCVKFDRPEKLQGVAEADEMLLPASQKGNKHLERAPRQRAASAAKRGVPDELVNIVVARDRGGQTIDFIAGRGALAASALHAHLKPQLQADVILVSDANTVYRTFAREAAIAHEPVDPHQGLHGRRQLDMADAIHIQNVRAYHGRFKTWLRHFNGVATRYLSNYLGWQWAIDLRRIADASTFFRAALGYPQR